MRILVIANYKENAGGISGVVFNQIKNLIKDKHETELFNTKKGCLVRFLLVFPLIIRIRKFQIIHIHGCSYLGFYPIVLGVFVSKILFTKRTIVSFHGGGADLFLKKYGSIARLFFNKVDYVTVMSEHFQDIFLKYNIRTKILPNLFDISEREYIPPDFTNPKIVSLRSLNFNYNISDIIIAFKQVKNKYQNAELKIIGDGSESGKLKQLVKEHKLENVLFLGSIPNEKIPDELAKSNIMVTVPSLDNQPLSILEAFSTGIPVISSNVGGIPSIINNMVNGFLVDVNQPVQIFEKIVWIMSNSEIVIEICARAKEVLQNHKWKSVRITLYKLYGNC